MFYHLRDRSWPHQEPICKSSLSLLLYMTLIALVLIDCRNNRLSLWLFYFNKSPNYCGSNAITNKEHVWIYKHLSNWTVAWCFLCIPRLHADSTVMFVCIRWSSHPVEIWTSWSISQSGVLWGWDPGGYPGWYNIRAAVQSLQGLWLPGCRAGRWRGE